MTPRLTRCADCDHPVSRLAEACPSCGRPLRRRRRSPAFALLDFAAIMLIGVILVPLALGLLGMALAEIPRALRMLAALF